MMPTPPRVASQPGNVRRIASAGPRRSRFVLALVALLSSLSCTGSSPACAPVSGGEQSSLMQLRRVSFGDDQISLLFALRPGATYGIPAHEVSADGGRIRVRVPGGRLRHPDGTPSYFGATEPVPPPGRLQTVSVSSENDGSVVVEIVARGSACPRVTSRRYGLGTTFSAALISIALRDGPVVALDPDRQAPGQAAQVIGAGFAPESAVTFQIGPRTVWSSQTDKQGFLDTVLFMPDRIGRGSALMRDASGSAVVWFLVDESYRR